MDIKNYLLIKEVIILQDLRCCSCGRLLAKAIVRNGYVEIKCTRCGYENQFKWWLKEEENHSQDDVRTQTGVVK